MGGSARQWAIVCALALALLAGMPASARAGFAAAPKQLSEPVASVTSPQARVDAAGNTIAIWEQNTSKATSMEQVAGRAVAADGTLGSPLTLSVPGQQSFEPVLGGGPGGEGFVAWRAGSSPTSILGRWIKADGSLGPVVMILAGSGTEEGVAPAVVVDSTGVATVAWYNQVGGTDKISLRRVNPDSSEEAQVNTTVTANFSFGAAALPGGATFLVAGAVTDVVAANGTVGAPVDAHTTGTVSALRTGIAFDSQGDGIIAWRRGLSEPFAVVARRINAAGAPIGSEIVVEPDTLHFVGAEQHAAVDSSGHFLVGWDRQDEGNAGHGYVRAVNSDGSLPDVVHAASAVAEPDPEPLLALDDRGFGIAAFDFFAGDAATSVVQGQVLSSTAAPIREPSTLTGGSAGGGSSLGNDPATGVATVVWESPSGAKEVAMATRYMEPPACNDSEAIVVLGLPVAAPLACSGIGINSAKVLTAPAHGTLGAFDRATRSIRYTPTAGYQGPDSFSYQIENDGGASATATVRIAVHSAPSAAPTPPLLANVDESNRVWRVGAALARFARAKRRPPVGTTFSFTLNEPATVTLVFSQRVGGRSVGGKCVAPTRRNHRRRSCTRSITRGTLTLAGHSAANRVFFQGRFSHAKALTPGSYALAISAANAAGQRSARANLSFTVVR